MHRGLGNEVARFGHLKDDTIVRVGLGRLAGRDGTCQDSSTVCA